MTSSNGTRIMHHAASVPSLPAIDELAVESLIHTAAPTKNQGPINTINNSTGHDAHHRRTATDLGRTGGMGSTNSENENNNGNGEYVFHPLVHTRSLTTGTASRIPAGFRTRSSRNFMTDSSPQGTFPHHGHSDSMSSVASVVSLGSTNSEHGFRSSALLKNMMQSHRNRNPYHDYVVLGLIGTGSIGSVEKVVRKHRTHLHGLHGLHGEVPSPERREELKRMEEEERRRKEERRKFGVLAGLVNLFQNCMDRDRERGGEGGHNSTNQKGQQCCFGPSFLTRTLRPKDAFQVPSSEDDGHDRLGTASSRSQGAASSMSIVSEPSNFSAPSSPMASPSNSTRSHPDASVISPEKLDFLSNTNSLSSSQHGFEIPAHPLKKPQHPLRRYALKSIRLDRTESGKKGKNDSTDSGDSGISAVDEKELRNEISILRSLDHPNIVRCIEVYEYRRMIYLVLDLCEGGDLYVLDPYSEKEAVVVMKQICGAVGFMHRRGIVHRDLKYENVMFVHRKSKRRKLEIKVIDFGLSMKYGNAKGKLSSDQVMNDFVGTIYTMAPEVIRGNYTYKCDSWSLGVMAYMLLSSQIPFCGKDMQEIARKIVRGTYSFSGKRWSHVSRQAKDFVASLLVRDALSRPNADQALRHPWLAGKKHHFSSKLHRRHSSECLGGTSFSALNLNPKISLDADICTSIEKYSAYSWLHRLALMVIAFKYTDQQTAQLRHIFSSYDEDQSGTVSINELKSAFLLHDKYNEEEMDQIFLAVDMNGAGKISWTEFLAATIETTGLIREEDFAEAFEQLDFDHNGYLNASDLREICGKDLPEDIIDQIIDESDITRDHKIWKDEFLALAHETYLIEQQRNQQFVEDQRRTKSICVHLRRSSSLGDLDQQPLERDTSGSSTDIIDPGPSREGQFSIEKEKSVRKASKMWK